MQCPVCGAYVTEADQFCGECGEALSLSSKPEHENSSKEPTRIQEAAVSPLEQKKRVRQTRVAVLVAGVIGLLVFVLVGGWGAYQLLTEQATPLPDQPLGIVGEILLEDTFDDPGSGWDIYAMDDAEAGYQAGAYQFWVHELRYDAWATSNRRADLANFVIEVDARRVAGPLDNDYGLLVRYQPGDDSFYLFAISSDGWYTVQRFYGREWEPLVDWTKSDLILQGEATNRLRVECLGSWMRFLVNGTLLTEVEDATFLSGDVGLLAGTFDDGGVVVAFDNLQVRDLAAP